jgi:hypothetical protein
VVAAVMEEAKEAAVDSEVATRAVASAVGTWVAD